MGTINPTQEQIRLIKDKYFEKPFVMINLLKFKRDSSGRKSKQLYHQYTKEVASLLQAIGGNVIFLGAVHDAFIGEQGNMWDEVLLVYYPSGEAFLRMIAMEEYQKANAFREAALEKCVLMVTQRLV